MKGSIKIEESTSRRPSASCVIQITCQSVWEERVVWQHHQNLSRKVTNVWTEKVTDNKMLEQAGRNTKRVICHRTRRDAHSQQGWESECSRRSDMWLQAHILLSRFLFFFFHVRRVICRCRNKACGRHTSHNSVNTQSSRLWTTKGSAL